MPYQHEWKPVKPEDSDYKCDCGSDNVWYRKWESYDGGHQDVNYFCDDCGKKWWVEGPDY